MKRCAWTTNDPLYIQYHDHEWGIPVYDDQKLFEMLILEGAQAGLSWLTILKKRENYQKAFDYFDPKMVAQYDDMKIEELLKNPGIVRNRLKINAAIENAKAFLNIQAEYGSFKEYIWQFVAGQPKINHWKTIDEVPVSTKESDAMSKSLKKHGFKFVGTIICYSYMQAVGMVNDHTVDCFCYQQQNRVVQ